MAANNTNFLLEMLQPADVGDFLCFCGSGLLLGALVYVMLTWFSRHKAGSASITRRPHRRSSYDRRSNNSLVTAAFTFHRQTSSQDHFDAMAHKSSFRAPPSTRSSSAAKLQERQRREPNHTPSQLPPHQDQSHLGNSVRGLHATQTPPPAYESIIRAYQETRT
uniref:Myc target 1a n=1 Tax=Maylandia zebra TaxID=106582 RepID=A0A3P9ARZ5_9CICH